MSDNSPSRPLPIIRTKRKTQPSRSDGHDTTKIRKGNEKNGEIVKLKAKIKQLEEKKRRDDVVLEEECTCSVCRNIDFLPLKSFKCDHYICISCTTGILDTAHRQCPLCRQSFIEVKGRTPILPEWEHHKLRVYLAQSCDKINKQEIMMYDKAYKIIRHLVNNLDANDTRLNLEAINNISSIRVTCLPRKKSPLVQIYTYVAFIPFMIDLISNWRGTLDSTRHQLRWEDMSEFVKIVSTIDGVHAIWAKKNASRDSCFASDQTRVDFEIDDFLIVIAVDDMTMDCAFYSHHDFKLAPSVWSLVSHYFDIRQHIGMILYI